jgi:hypothetical protein
MKRNLVPFLVVVVVTLLYLIVATYRGAGGYICHSHRYTDFETGFSGEYCICTVVRPNGVEKIERVPLGLIDYHESSLGCGIKKGD